MELTWPLVGRSAELAQVEALLGDGYGAVVIAGAAGVGKTRLAAECLARAGTAGFLPLRVSATSATKALPFGAFANLLPEHLGAATRANLLGQVVQSIVSRGAGKPVAILVDDAHLLDDSSAALTLQLVQAQKAFVLATLRSGAPACDAIIALWKDGLAKRLEVAPLSGPQVEELLVATLGGPIEGSSARLFQDGAQGNALFLRELVLGALESSALTRISGVWRLNASLPISPRLSEIIAGRLASLSEAEHRALGVVAVGEPLAIATFDAVEPDFNLEALERKGLIRVERDDRRLVLRLDHPLHGEVLRSKLSPLTMRRTAMQLAEAVEGFGARRKTDVLPVGVWRLEGGGPMRPDLMVRAALAAQQRNDFPLAERLVRAALEAGAGFEAAVLLGQLLWQQRRAAEAELHLQSLHPMAETDEQKVLLASVRIEVIDLGLSDIDAALKVAEEAEISIQMVSHRDRITAERARVLGRHGRNADAVAIVDPLVNRSQGRTLVAACFAAGTSMAVTGQFDRAMEVTETGYQAHLALTGPPVAYTPELHFAMRTFACLYVGRLADAEELAQAQYAKALADHSPLAIGFFSLALGIHAAIQGRCRTAVRRSNEAQAMFQRIGFPFMERNALSLVAFGCALQGSVGDARRALDQVDALGVAASDHSGSILLQARAWTEVAAGDRARGIEIMYEAVELARRSGAKALESWALHDLARLGRAAEVAADLMSLHPVVEGPMAPARAAHAVALMENDAGALELASRTFEDLGVFLLAAEASADAAVIRRRQGEVRRATAAQIRSSALAARCEGAVSPALAVSAPARAVLTPRELEVAGLAAGGLSDKQIAQRLFLSHRTVENKLHSAYAKLGVSSRAELAEVLQNV